MPDSGDPAVLFDQNLALEALVADRTRELHIAVKEFEAFTYSVAHDLRAPLRAIHGFSQVLLEDFGDRFEGDALDYMHRIRRASARMSDVIDDLLKLSQVGRGRIELARTDLSSLVRDVADRLVDLAPARHVQITIEPGIEVQGNHRLLSIAFENILGNAWKFTRPRAVAEIRVFTRMDGQRRLICVSDNGTGFDMRYCHKLFSPFERLHASDQFEGTGIGLVTVARIIERHCGEVSIVGVVDGGATVSIFLPP
jgi:light-regulated signal transduction histidine kinase (bacteriophytochrome)